MRTPLVLLALVTVGSASAQVSFSGGTYLQNFDTLSSDNAATVSRPTSAAAVSNIAGQAFVNNTTLPGWIASFSNPNNVAVDPPVGANGNWIHAGVAGTPNNLIPDFNVKFLRSGTGSNNAGSIYNFGAASSTNRALGSLNSGGLTSPLINYYGLALTNTAGVSISEFTLGYLGKQFRLGTNDGVTDRLDFSYQVFAGAVTAADIRSATGWTDANSLDFVSPVNTGTVGALDGNLAANQTAVSATVSGLAWATGTTLVIRWNDFDKASSDHALAIDNVTFAAVPEPASMAVLGLGLAAFRKRRRS